MKFANATNLNRKSGVPEIESGRNDAMTTGGQEMNNSTKVSAILWYRSTKIMRLSRETLPLARGIQSTVPVHSCCAGDAPKTMHRSGLAGAEAMKQLDDGIGNTLVSVCGNSAFGPETLCLQDR